MGYGDYSVEAHRAITEQRKGADATSVFRENACHPKMNPKGIRFRESRDSAAHPNSVGVVFALDVSGSMGEIPHQLATETLPTFMESIHAVLPDPQLLFMAFGNAHSDRSPIQIGQFESEAALIDQWLAAIHVEGAGGGWGESYDLAMYLAARHTAMDCWEQRKRKGYFIMTGDETPFIETSPMHVAGLIGDSIEKPIFISDLAKELAEKFHTFFLIPDPERAARDVVKPVWEILFRERCLVLATPEDTAVVSAVAIGIEEGQIRDLATLESHLAERHGRTGEERKRVVETLARYLEARAKGEIAGPGMLYRRSDVPSASG